MKKKVAIDLVPIRAGEGGAGSGIWTYARELISHMDSVDFQGLEIVCFVDAGQALLFSNLRNIRLICLPGFGKNILLRLGWVHLLLPILCLWYRIGALHKLATETPMLCPVKRITTVHDFYYEFLLENNSPEMIRFYERMENFYFSLVTRICFQRSRVIITVSDATRSEALRRFPQTKAVVTSIHNGSQMLTGYRSACSEDLFAILFVAKLMPYKGQLEALKAIEILLGAHPELRSQIRLVFHGFLNDVTYAEQLRQESSRSVFGDMVEFQAYHVDKTLDELYAEADLLLFLSQYEGFGLPVIEAQARGVPVICSNIEVLREVGGNGALYVNREDADEVADALLKLIRQTAERERLVAAGLENSKRFDWQKTARETLAVYKKVLE